MVGSDSFFRVGRGGSELMVGYNPLFLLDKLNDLTLESIFAIIGLKNMVWKVKTFRQYPIKYQLSPV